MRACPGQALDVLTYNLVAALKALALPDTYRKLRPHTLQQRLFNLAGQLVRGARQVTLKIPAILDLPTIYARARQKLLDALKRTRESLESRAMSDDDPDSPRSESAGPGAKPPSDQEISRCPVPAEAGSPAPASVPAPASGYLERLFENARKARIWASRDR